jgi:hypothetical protein
MTSNAACAAPTAATSTEVTMIVNPVLVPSVTITPSANNVCPGTNISFTPNPVNGGTPSYQWQVNNVNVATGATFSSNTLNNGDVVKVIMTSNATCVSPAIANSTVAIIIKAGTPAIPGTITGSAAQCINQSGLSYSVAAVANATTYNWILPSGWTITSGAGTRTITVQTSGTATSGNISVTSENSCGISNPQVLAVNVVTGVPAAPGVITGTTAICPTKTLNYSITLLLLRHRPLIMLQVETSQW